MSAGSKGFPSLARGCVSTQALLVLRLQASAKSAWAASLLPFIFVASSALGKTGALGVVRIDADGAGQVLDGLVVFAVAPRRCAPMKTAHPCGRAPARARALGCPPLHPARPPWRRPRRARGRHRHSAGSARWPGRGRRAPRRCPAVELVEPVHHLVLGLADAGLLGGADELLGRELHRLACLARQVRKQFKGPPRVLTAVAVS